MRFGVRPAAGRGGAAADDAAVAHDDAADRGVRPGGAKAPPRQRQGGTHVGSWSGGVPRTGICPGGTGLRLGSHGESVIRAPAITDRTITPPPP